MSKHDYHDNVFFNQKSYEFGKTRAANYVKGLEKALLDVSNGIEVRHDLQPLVVL